MSDRASAARVVSTRDATLAEWADAHAASPQATFFHGPEWSEIWSAYLLGEARPAPIRVEFADGRTAVIGFTQEPGPHVRGRRLPIRRWSLSPAGCYGGWVSSDVLEQPHVDALVDEVLQRRALVWRLSPADAALSSRRVPSLQDDDTYLIHLGDGADSAHSRWHRRPRQYATAAARSGVTVREARSWEDWLAYDRVYRHAIRRWHSPSFVYSTSLFELLYERASPNVRLWLAEYEGDPVAGELVFTAHRHAVSWHAASRVHVVKGAAHLLSWELTSTLADEGFLVHDLNPSGGHPGATTYKTSVGAEEASAPILVRRHPVERVLAPARRAVSRVRALGGRTAL